MHSLPVFVRLNGRKVILIGGGDAAQAKRQLLERAGAVIVGEGDAAPLAIVAVEDDEDALAAIARLKARGILVNAVDRPESCDFTLPAIIDRSPVIIAIGTGGASAGLAKALRIRLEAMLPAAMGRLAFALGSARPKLRARWPDARDRRLAIDAALSPGGALDPLTDHADDAVDHWLSTAHTDAVGGIRRIHITSDDPDDLTLGQARLLGQADLVCHDPAIALAILARARADARRIASLDVPPDAGNGLIIVVERG